MVNGLDEDDKKLITQVQSGDRKALDRLIKQYYQSIFGYFYRATSDYHQSKDLTQEVFIKMVVNINKYKPKSHFKSWLFTIASNHLKNHWRTISRRPKCSEMPEEMLWEDDALDSFIQRNVISSALNTLPQEQREAVVLRFYNGFTMKEIAKITDIKETTVKARIKYGLDKLKKRLEGLENE